MGFVQIPLYAELRQKDSAARRPFLDRILCTHRDAGARTQMAKFMNEVRGQKTLQEEDSYEANPARKLTRKLSGPFNLNRDRRHYLSDTPPKARYPPEGSLSCDTPCHPLPSAAIGQIWGGGIARYPAIPEEHNSQGENPPKIRKKNPRNKVPGNFWTSSH